MGAYGDSASDRHGTKPGDKEEKKKPIIYPFFTHAGIAFSFLSAYNKKGSTKFYLCEGEFP